ncbi:hypothetical protein EPN18_06835 [bacterium]|nr:MAG: hypothetical protein EPN18_06835 [bacterium]
MDAKVSLQFLADGSKLQSVVAGASANITAFGSSARSSFATANKYIDYTTQHIGALGTALTALSTGMVLKKLFSVADYMPIDDALLMMQANLKMSARELDGFKQSLSEFAGSQGEDMAAVFRNASNLSVAYKPDAILKIMDASAMASDAMGVDITTVRERVVQLMKLYKQTPEEAGNIASALVASRVDIETLDVMLQRSILKGGTGKSYHDLLAFFGGLKKAGVDSSRVVLQFSGALEALFDSPKKLKGIGVDAFKLDPATKKKVKKDSVELLEEIDRMLKTKYKHLGEDQIVSAFDDAFGQGAGKGLLMMIAQLDKLKAAREEQGRSAQIAAERAAKADEKWEEQLQRIKGHLDGIKTRFSVIYDAAKKPVKYMAESPNLTKGLAYGTAAASVAIAGTLLYKKGGAFLKGLKGIGGTAGGIAEGKAIEAATGVAPVFVTNWPAKGMMGESSPIDALRKLPGGGGIAEGVAKNAGGLKSLLFGGVGAAGFGATAGLVGVAALGGAVAGTGINYALDRLVEKFSGQDIGLGGYLYDLFHGSGIFQNEINIRIDKDGRIIQEGKTNQNTNITVDRGDFTPAWY